MTILSLALGALGVLWNAGFLVWEVFTRRWDAAKQSIKNIARIVALFGGAAWAFASDVWIVAVPALVGFALGYESGYERGRRSQRDAPDRLPG